MTLVSLPGVQSLNAKHTGGIPLLALIAAMCNLKAYLRQSRPLCVSLMGSSREMFVMERLQVFSLLLCPVDENKKELVLDFETDNLLASYLGTTVIIH